MLLLWLYKATLAIKGTIFGLARMFDIFGYHVRLVYFHPVLGCPSRVSFRIVNPTQPIIDPFFCCMVVVVAAVVVVASRCMR